MPPQFYAIQAEPFMTQYLWLIPVGFLVGAYGTLIGAGGGFVLVPFLLLVYPKDSPELLTSISLAVVFFNALSGSLAYARMKRVDYASGMVFAAATIPGAVLGALTTSFIPRRVFDAAFGVLMLAASMVLMIHPIEESNAEGKETPGDYSRTVVEADGTVHRYSYNSTLGVVISLFVGILVGVFLQEFIRRAIGASRLVSGDFLGAIAKWAVIIFSVLAALVQLGIAPELIEILFTGIVFMVALAGGLAFGLGGREDARELIQKLREEMRGD